MPEEIDISINYVENGIVAHVRTPRHGLARMIPKKVHKMFVAKDKEELLSVMQKILEG